MRDHGWSLTFADGATLPGEGAPALRAMLLVAGDLLAPGEAERAELLLRTLEATPVTIPAPPMPVGDDGEECDE